MFAADLKSGSLVERRLRNNPPMKQCECVCDRRERNAALPDEGNDRAGECCQSFLKRGNKLDSVCMNRLLPFRLDRHFLINCLISIVAAEVMLVRSLSSGRPCDDVDHAFSPLLTPFVGFD